MAVGVLALQGSFNEHLAALRRIGVKGVEIRKAEQLENVSSLIIPGGESTTMAKLAELHNLFPALREFVKMGKPVWGTCAGLIFLADKATGQKTGGQELVGGLDCTVHRNFFGSQIQSFEAELPVPELAATEGGPPSFRAVFIRAPAILEVGPGVEVLASVSVPSNKNVDFNPALQEGSAESDTSKVIVAVKQGNILATAFHPELTIDSRWHSYFMKMSPSNNEITAASSSSSSSYYADQESYLYNKQPKTDLPIYE
ncbi:putative pyridoxal 5'-phosphate synthase (glutamine hydrolyzing) [Helianthus anomalus]